MTREEKIEVIKRYITIRERYFSDHEINTLYKIVSNPDKYDGLERHGSPKLDKGPYNSYKRNIYINVTLIVEEHNLHIEIEKIIEYDDSSNTIHKDSTQGAKEFLDYLYKYFGTEF